MGDTRYLLVERLASRSRGRAVLWAAHGDEPPSLRIERLSEREADEQARSGAYQAVVPDFPLDLVQPVGEIIPQALPSGERSQAFPWWLEAIGLQPDSPRGTGIRIAVLDTGIDLGHPAFAPIQERISCEDYTLSADGMADSNGHGTHCAALLFGQDIADRRISVAPDVGTAFIGKVLDRKGRGSSLALLQAMSDAVYRHKAHVVSMSLSFNFPAQIRGYCAAGMPLELAAARALDALLANIRLIDNLVEAGDRMARQGAGTLFVAAAGNHSTDKYRLPLAPPASGAGVVSVAAAQQGETGLNVARFSNTGATLCAPGVGILSAFPLALSGARGWCEMSGTSMATPLVAGAAALWAQRLRERRQSVTPERLRGSLLENAWDQFAPETMPGEYGAGLVRVPQRQGAGG